MENTWRDPGGRLKKKKFCRRINMLVILNEPKYTSSILNNNNKQESSVVAQQKPVLLRFIFFHLLISTTIMHLSSFTNWKVFNNKYSRDN